MPNPTKVTEWAEKCNVDYLVSMRVEGKSNGHVRHGLCLYCADAYARQQVEATRERVAQVVDQWACSTTCDSTGAPCEHIRVAVTIAAATRALKDAPPQA